MTNEDYNGWVNRETWCFNLGLNNDPVMYDMARDAALRGIRRMNDMQSEYRTELTLKPDLFIGEAIMDMMQELYGIAIEEHIVAALQMFSDIGSLWRVDLREVGSAWVEDLEEVDA